MGLGFAAEVDVAHVGTHRGQPPQHALDDGGVACGEQSGQVFDRDAQRLERPEEIADVLTVVSVTADRVDHR
ncbi:hypothetical protein EU78_08345 [Mycolicibacterium rufum]|nr:hypothetical protein EU78_08345 [Mycolicibacterium rufum]